jgi:hypothetical protein
MPHSQHDRLQRLVMLNAPREKVWAEIGGFGAIADWHPVIAEAEIVELAGETHRHLTTTDGDLIIEKLLETGPYFYRYTIVDSGLPVEDYRATLSCVAEKDGCHVYWSSDFEPTDPSADDIIAGIYETGLAALRDRFDKG